MLVNEAGAGVWMSRPSMSGTGHACTINNFIGSGGEISLCMHGGGAWMSLLDVEFTGSSKKPRLSGPRLRREFRKAVVVVSHR